MSTMICLAFLTCKVTQCQGCVFQCLVSHESTVAAGLFWGAWRGVYTVQIVKPTEQL